MLFDNETTVWQNISTVENGNMGCNAGGNENCDYKEGGIEIVELREA
jgi:hypothetical protein